MNKSCCRVCREIHAKMTTKSNCIVSKVIGNNWRKKKNVTFFFSFVSMQLMARNTPTFVNSPYDVLQETLGSSTDTLQFLLFVLYCQVETSWGFILVQNDGVVRNRFVFTFEFSNSYRINLGFHFLLCEYPRILATVWGTCNCAHLEVTLISYLISKKLMAILSKWSNTFFKISL